MLQWKEHPLAGKLNAWTCWRALYITDYPQFLRRKQCHNILNGINEVELKVRG